jgi:hypothetical protein
MSPRWPLLALLFPAVAVAAGPPSSWSPALLSVRIDAHLAHVYKLNRAVPSPRAGDEEFLRRAYLDLTGRIPSVAEARTFLGSRSASKREAHVEKLLRSPNHRQHAAQLWRGLLVPQATTNLPTQQLGVSFEAWVRQQLQAGERDGQIVRGLLTTRLDYLDWSADGKPQLTSGLSPLAFYQANDLKPETVGAAVGRAFLGLRLECAQCHDHPFDKWTRRQAWEMAAFFAGVSPLEPVVKPAPGLALRRKLGMPNKSGMAEARFLDGCVPDWKKQPDPRRAFADWLLRPGNPYFARVMANRLWANLFGVGIVDPPDDWGPHNPPSHPELLADLASAYESSGFDSDFLIRAITTSKAYQRTSRLTHPSQKEPRLFARMNVKGLSAEQLFDSLALATGYRDPVPLAARTVDGWPRKSPRGQFLAKFGGGAGRTDMQVSILQALSLMNGEWVARQTDPRHGNTLKALLGAPFLNDEGRVEALFLATLSRRPTEEERLRYRSNLREADDRGKGLADVLWVLINSEEFLVNR